jgi:replicative DNA helicase
MTVIDPANDSRTPPHDVDAEQGTLGAVLMAPHHLGDVAGIISTADLYRPAHQLIYDTLLDLDDSRTPITPITVVDRLRARGLLDRVGGAPYLHTLAERAPLGDQATYYARIVADRAALRRLVQAGTRIAQIGYSGTGDVDDLVDEAQAEMDRATATRDTAASDMWRVDDDDDWFESLFEPIDTSRIVPTPYGDLTDLLSGGARPGELVIVAARPSMGKSVVGLDLVRHAALRHDIGSLYVSLEMPRAQVMERLYAAEARVPYQAIRSHQIGARDAESLRQVRAQMRARPLYVATPTRCTISTLQNRLRALQRRGEQPRLLVVDHVGLMDSRGRVENRTQEISAYTRGLKQIAMAWDIAVVALCQLNREAERRDDHRPRLSDLRDSGSVEQDADVVIGVYREEYYNRESPRSGEADLLVLKNRSGALATVTVASQLHYQRFRDMAPGA